MATRSILLIALLAASSVTAAAAIERNPYNFVLSDPVGHTIFDLGHVSYLADTKNPKASVRCTAITYDQSTSVPIALVKTNVTLITKDTLETIISTYLGGDDVFSHDFLDGLYISSRVQSSLDASAVEYISSFNTTWLFLDPLVTANTTMNKIALESSADLPAGPYLASVDGTSISFSTVYRLYPDTYKTFLFGAYGMNDGENTHRPVGMFSPKYQDALIPVPSRIYSWDDARPLAGSRVAIKDLYDIKGLQTSAGSHAWSVITPVANGTAPSVQHILNLGGVVVGKQKLAQFASGANPWEWQDEQYPFNPRGDGWLTCSASSSGGGCAVAAYEWLDYAVGSDTGSSMRRPAAVAGVYGQRPSQGLMSLERVIPLGAATDTAGVFSRDPHKWVKFAKAWYAPHLYQDTSITGLSPLVVPDTDTFPKTIIYPTDYLPLNNSAAEPILEKFIEEMARVFDMRVKKVNFTATVQNSTDPIASNFTVMNQATSTINSWSSWLVVGKPLITAWRDMFEGRFPPIDPARRPGWIGFNESITNQASYDAALETKRQAVAWYEDEFQYSTAESCSESVMLYDIGTGGLPSFRERMLNESPDASYLAVRPEGAAVTGASICPIFGCADFTVPIGQVPYQSNVTFHEEMVPVTINMVVKRGCDFVLYNMIEKLGDEGILKTVKTGRTAY
ncbi:hypothetical protein COCC4DRAFT_35994 [Bipolaris maydis ATCC 48331]|uniref:Uncharacterized protein n=2 Tax=Cochliobolus heterostrophus TaxID=5016 RepID=M2V9C8_COCH5|nr:uncharacterized protein COCC4DRAFT_35994 [Bipolaris maydis ATCC 48331]EMD96303.1 hypothetical protein COCHEDRAFT_1191386 [Bipolaris maydis C5]KAH7562134.1 hypothetical protein BM1_03238 [Bipolaris maydis]ENI11163.1 hypothetical protein COCC4DRAFT_35994 [Bipolaris maydis ATCC 48331]KAJ5030957.1 amidase signature domain-containing protein [Bipolaris maydis]KAJ5065979.1 amidase family protein [Bipolaris maydis]